VSARSLAAVFDVEVADLRDLRAPAGGPRISVPLRPLRPLLGVLAALVTGGALFLASNGFADQVLMDVSVTLNTTTPGSAAIETSEWKTQMIVHEGMLVEDVNDLRLKELRFTIVPILLADGMILIEMQVFKQQGDSEVLVTAPRLVIADGQEAEVRTGDEGRSFRFSITPRRQSLL
jgi:hypothetical protein